MSRSPVHPTWSLLLLLGSALAVFPGTVFAQEQETARKRQFAEALKRRERFARETQRVAGNSSNGIPQRSFYPEARITHRSYAGTNLRATSSAGTPPASPLQPSGFGSGRDGFVSEMFEQTFGRAPSQAELDHFSRSMARGMTSLEKAKILWLSPEHRAMLRNGTAPNRNFTESYYASLAAGNRAR